MEDAHAASNGSSEGGVVEEVGLIEEVRGVIATRKGMEVGNVGAELDGGDDGVSLLKKGMDHPTVDEAIATGDAHTRFLATHLLATPRCCTSPVS